VSILTGTTKFDTPKLRLNTRGEFERLFNRHSEGRRSPRRCGLATASVQALSVFNALSFGYTLNDAYALIVGGQ
jgi:NADH:ubiquinone oxidoreductase subunit D